MGFNSGFKGLIFVDPCIVIYSYSTTNKMHLLSQIIYSCKTLYVYLTVVQSIIRSSKLRIQQRYMSNSCCLGASCFSVQILLYHIAVFALHGFPLMFLYWYVSFVCLALINLIFIGLCIVIYSYSATNSRSQWPRGLRPRSAAARLLRSWVRIPPGAWIFVCCECCVLSRRGLCEELITRPEESYRLWCVILCDLETTRMRRPWPVMGRSATEKKKSTTNKIHLLFQIIYSCKTFYRFRTVFPSIIRRSKLRIQQRYMSNTCCYLLLSWMRWNCIPSHPR